MRHAGKDLFSTLQFIRSRCRPKDVEFVFESGEVAHYEITIYATLNSHYWFKKKQQSLKMTKKKVELFSYLVTFSTGKTMRFQKSENNRTANKTIDLDDCLAHYGGYFEADVEPRTPLESSGSAFLDG